VALTRCVDCNATVKPDELVCYACGTKVEGRGKSKFGSGFSTVVTMLFFGSFLLTIASLFVEGMPSFGKCVMANMVLLVVRSSSGEMVSKKS
jgi:uncharacterized paraquat-inducible protein A